MDQFVAEDIKQEESVVKKEFRTTRFSEIRSSQVKLDIARGKTRSEAWHSILNLNLTSDNKV